jgi:hypothetical protein
MLKVQNLHLTLKKLSQAKMANFQLKMMSNYGLISQTITISIQESNLQVILKFIMITDYNNATVKTGIFTVLSGLINHSQKHQLDLVLPHMLKDVVQTIDLELIVLLEFIISIGIIEHCQQLITGNSEYYQLLI